MSKYEEEFHIHAEDELLFEDPLFQKELKQHAEENQNNSKTLEKKPASVLLAENESVDQLTLQAIAEIEKDASRAKDRCSSMGVGGWRQRTISTNKRYLNNTIIGALQTNRRIEKRLKEGTWDPDGESMEEKLSEEKRGCSRKSKLTLHSTILGNLQSNRAIDQKYERAKKTSLSDGSINNYDITKNRKRKNVEEEKTLISSEDDHHSKEGKKDDEIEEDEWVEREEILPETKSEEEDNSIERSSSDSTDENCSLREKKRKKKLYKEKTSPKEHKRLQRRRSKKAKAKRIVTKKRKMKSRDDLESNEESSEESDDYVSSSSSDSDKYTAISKRKRRRKVSRSTSDYTDSKLKESHSRRKFRSKKRKVETI